MMTIEDLKKFDNNNLTSWAVLFKKQSRLWVIFNKIVSYFGVILIIAPLFLNNLLKVPIAYHIILTGTVLVTIGLYFSIKETYLFIKKAYRKQYGLKLHGNWDYTTVSKIRLGKFNDFCEKNSVVLAEERVKETIEALKREQQSNDYKPFSTVIVCILIIGFIISFITMSSKFVNSYKELIQIHGTYLLMLLVLIGFIYIIEFSVAKEIKLKPKNKYSRLIRVLENYHLIDHLPKKK